MERPIFDPDVTRRNDEVYWAAVLVTAIRADDAQRIALAQERLRQLGITIEVQKSQSGQATGGGNA